MNNHRYLHWILLLVLSSLWGTSFLLVSLAIRSLEPASVVFVRLTLGAIVLLLTLWLIRQKLPATWPAWTGFLVMAMTGNIVPFYLISWGQQYIASGTAGMIMAVMPLATMVIAHIFVPGEKLTIIKLLGVVIGMGGVFVLLNPGHSGHPMELQGAVAVLAAALLYAVNAVLAKRLPMYAPEVTAAGVLIMAAIGSVPLVLVTGDSFPASLSLTSALAVFWLGIGATGLATIVFFRLVHLAGPTFLSNINYLIPVIAFFSGALILAEPVHISSILALILILSGIAISRIKS